MQDVPFRLEYQRGRDNVVADALSRRENVAKPLEPRPILLQSITLERAKEEGYHPSMEVSELEKGENGEWLYRGQQVVEDPGRRQEVLRRSHNDE